MEKLISKLTALGIPGLVLLIAVSTSGLAGGAAIVAALAATYTLGADASTINTYYDNVLNELKQNTGAQSSKHYTYVSGAR